MGFRNLCIELIDCLARILFPVLFGLASYLCWARLSAQQPLSSELGTPLLKTFQKEDYGSHPNNFAVLQDRRGIIYVANAEALLEYTGHFWRNVPIDFQTAVFSICATDDGRIFLGCLNELGYLEPDSVGVLRYKSLKSNLPSEYAEFDKVWSCHAIGSTIYFQTDGFIAAWDRATQSFRCWRPITDFFLSWKIGQRLLVHDRMVGLHELVEGQLKLVKNGELLAGQRLLALMKYNIDTLLVCTDPGGFNLLHSNGLTPWRTEGDAYIERSKLYHATRLSNGNIAVGTLAGGLLILDRYGKYVMNVNMESGLKSQEIHFVFEDRDGGIWLAQNNGLARIETPGLVSTFNQSSTCKNLSDSGLEGTPAAVLRHRGRIFVATSLGVFQSQVCGGDFPTTVFRRLPQLGKIQATGLLPWGNSLLVSTREGVFELTDYGASPIYSGFTKMMFRSQKDSSRVYLGLEAGLASIRRTGAGWLNEGSLAGFRAEVNSLAEDQVGSLWIGTQQNSLFRLDFDRGNRNQPHLRAFSVDSTSGILTPVKNKVFRIGNRLFFDINEQGLCIFDSSRNRFIPYLAFGANFANSTRNIISIAEDDRGRVYIATREKLRSTAAEIYRLTPISPTKYKTERLPTDRFLTYPPEVIFPESNGVLWIGEADGMIRFDTRIAKNYKQSFLTLIRLITLNSNRAFFGGTYLDDRGMLVLEQPTTAVRRLPYARGNNFRFHCAATTYDEPNLTEFQYLLEGNDNGWSEWTKEPFKDYTNLLEGSYRFRVRAKNAHGHIGEEAAYSFVITPPLYRTIWAYLVYVLLGVGLVYSFIQYRHQALIARKSELEQQVRDRTIDLEMAIDELEVKNQLLSSQKRQLEENEIELTKQRNQLSIRNFMLEEQKEKLERKNQEIAEEKLKTERANQEISLAKAELENAYEEIRATNENLEIVNKQLQAQKQELEQKNKELIIERAEKLQAQKMAGLGEITSIVAHEINTPLSSIIGSLTNVQQTLATALPSLISVLALSDQFLQEQFWSLMKLYQSNAPTLSSREERALLRRLEPWFAEIGYSNPEYAALQVIRTGLGESVTRFRELFEAAAHHQDLFQLIVKLGAAWRQLFAMHHSADRARLIVASLQSYVKQPDDSGTPVSTDLIETIKLVLTLYDYYISRGIELRVELPDQPLPAILAYPQLLKQAWTNLIMSSVYAMNFKGQLFVKILEHEQSIEIILQDSGPEISADRMELLYKPEANARGTEPPVSLWICFNVFVEQHGGEIHVNSSAEGTTFRVLLPKTIPPQAS